jgi:hypothetical protein
MPTGEPKHSGRLLRTLGPATPWLAALVVLALAWLSRGYTSDDAFIPGRYALRLAEGRGYTFRDGPATDGVTGPLLLAVELVATWLGADPVGASKLVGALAVALAAGLVVHRARQRATGTLSAVLIVFGLGVSGAMAMHAQSGLETGLATLVVTLGGLGASARVSHAEPSRLRRARRLALAAVLAALLLLPWLRPELVPLAWAFGLVWVRARPRPAASTALVVASAALGLGSVIAFRLAMFGRAIPLSAQAKPTDLGNGLGYALVALSVLFGLGLVPVLHEARSSRTDGALGLALVVSLVTVILGGGDWMPGGRLLVPVAPLTWMLFGLGLARLSLTRSHARPRWLPVLLGLLCLGPQAALTALSLGQADDVAQSRARAGAELRSLLERESRVIALVDVGFLAYRARWEPFDLAGVTDPEVGTRPGAHCAKRVTVDELLARNVDTLVLHSGSEPRIERGVITAMRGHPVEQQIVFDPRTRALFQVVAVVPYARGYHYVVLRRRV